MLGPTSISAIAVVLPRVNNGIIIIIISLYLGVHSNGIIQSFTVIINDSSDAHIVLLAFSSRSDIIDSMIFGILNRKWWNFKKMLFIFL